MVLVTIENLFFAPGHFQPSVKREQPEKRKLRIKNDDGPRKKYAFSKVPNTAKVLIFFRHESVLDVIFTFFHRLFHNEFSTKNVISGVPPRRLSAREPREAPMTKVRTTPPTRYFFFFLKFSRFRRQQHKLSFQIQNFVSNDFDSFL